MPFPHQRCPHPCSAAATWAWVKAARDLSKGVLLDFWVHLYKLIYAWGEAAAQLGAWVDGLDHLWWWQDWLCSEVSRTDLMELSRLTADDWAVYYCASYTGWKPQPETVRNSVGTAAALWKIRLKTGLENGLVNGGK
jgi:hypothetical protein